MLIWKTDLVTYRQLITTNIGPSVIQKISKVQL